MPSKRSSLSPQSSRSLFVRGEGSILLLAPGVLLLSLSSLLLGTVRAQHSASPISGAPPGVPSSLYNYFNSGSQQVWSGNTLLYENYLGKRSIEHNASFDFHTQYRICSNSKLFTAVSIMQLVERGAIRSIHDSVNDYLDESDLVAWGLDPKATPRWCPTIVNSTTCQNITFVSLMSMSSGIIPSITCPYTPSAWQYAYCISPLTETLNLGGISAVINLFSRHPLQYAPGPGYGPGRPNKYDYVNENFIILSFFIEKLSGLSLQDYYQQHIFNAMGLISTLYDPFSWSFNLHPLLASEYVSYIDSSASLDPYAQGRCDHIEVNPSFQSGSGGIISTVPDMVKWYTSLFLTRNTSVLTSTSIDTILYPWSLEPGDSLSIYYGLGVELIFDNPPLSPPVHAVAPSGIFYMGGSMCMFFTIMLWQGSTSLITHQPLVTHPIISVAARNNRILNVSRSTWLSAQNQRYGNWFTLTGFPKGWGADNSDLTDTQFLAMYTMFAFAAQNVSQIPVPTPTTAPPAVSPSPPPAQQPCPSTSSGGMSNGAVVAATLIPCLVIMAGIVVYFVKFAPGMHGGGSSVGGGSGVGSQVRYTPLKDGSSA